MGVGTIAASSLKIDEHFTTDQCTVCFEPYYYSDLCKNREGKDPDPTLTSVGVKVGQNKLLH